MQSHSHPQRQTAILLLAFGGPRSLEEVKPFLSGILSHRVSHPSLLDEIGTRYQAIGGKSPLCEITERQANALHHHLWKQGYEMEVVIGMRHWHPSINDTLTTLRAKGVRKVLCLILSPFITRATASGYHKAVRKALTTLDNSMEAQFVDSWHTAPLYLEAMTNKVRVELDRFSSQGSSAVTVLFTAHSLPTVVITGDPYVEYLNATITGILERLPLEPWHLAFQSKGRVRGEWLSPGIEDLLESLAGRGVKKVLAVPLSFVAEHLETLYDLDIVAREKALALGLEFQRVPSLNDDPLFIHALAAIIIRSLTTDDDTK